MLQFFLVFGLLFNLRRCQVFISRLYPFQYVAGGVENFSFLDYTNPNTLLEVLPNFYFEITQTPTHCKDSINMDELKEIRKREKSGKN